MVVRVFNIVFIVIAVFVLGLVSPAIGGTFGVDGDLGDWGITMSSGNNQYNLTGSTGATYGLVNGNPDGQTVTVPGYSTYMGLPVFNGWRGDYATANGTVYYHLEDTNDTSNYYYVGPQYGGQNFDAEFLGVSIDTTAQKLFVAISSGQRADNRNQIEKTFEPGDIRIKVGQKVFGVEVGGVIGNTSDWQQNGMGAFFNVDGNGYAASAVNYTKSTTEGRVAGSVWDTGTGTAADALWTTGVVNTTAKPQLKSENLQSTNQVRVGANQYIADLYYNQTVTKDVSQTSLGEHAWLEVAIDLAAIGASNENTPLTVSWAPGCANDDLLLSVTVPRQNPPVPEPSTLLCWGGLLLGGAFMARRRKQRLG